MDHVFPDCHRCSQEFLRQHGACRLVPLIPVHLLHYSHLLLPSQQTFLDQEVAAAVAAAPVAAAAAAAVALLARSRHRRAMHPYKVTVYLPVILHQPRHRPKISWCRIFTVSYPRSLLDENGTTGQTTRVVPRVHRRMCFIHKVPLHRWPHLPMLPRWCSRTRHPWLHR